MIRPVRSGERLSGHASRDEVQAGVRCYPEVDIWQGRPSGAVSPTDFGSLLCTITCFHWMHVREVGEVTTLSVEGVADLSVKHGLVTYDDGEGLDSGARKVRSIDRGRRKGK